MPFLRREKRSSGLCRANPTAMVGAVEVEYYSNGFALLTAAPREVDGYTRTRWELEFFGTVSLVAVPHP